jgi:hypothetical protein
MAPLHGGNAGGESALNPRLAGSSAADAGSGARAGSSAAPSPKRPVTRLQHGIRKPKTYTDGTIKYGRLATISEPKNLVVALHNPNWKPAMDIEHGALQKNKTWHWSLLNMAKTSLIACWCLR